MVDLCLCSNAAAYARQRLTDAVDKLKPGDAAADAAAEADNCCIMDAEMSSSAVMHTTLTVLLRYQRLLLSQFITTDKLPVIDLRGL